MMIAYFALLLAATTPAAAPRVLTLDEALASARAHQPQVRQAAAATEAALARADESLAPMLPQISGNAGYQWGTLNIRGGAESWNTSGDLTLRLSANQLLYDFGQTRGRWRASKAIAEAQRDSEHTTLDQVLFTVRSAFFQARAAKELVRVADETLSNQNKHLEQVQGFVDVGTQPEIAMAQSKTNVANAQVALINAQNGYETARAVLNQAMGVEESTAYDVADESPAPLDGEDGPLKGLVDEAVKARPELAALAGQILAQELSLRAIKGAYGPTLDASTGLSDVGTSIPGLTWNWSAALTLTIPIFNGGLTDAQVRESKAGLASLRAQYDLEHQQVRLDVDRARLAVRAAKAAVEASAQALLNAGDLLRLAEGRYEAGVGSIIELGDAQVAATSAGQQKVQSDYSLAEARAGLLRALGRQ
jgi:outer membrane protein